MDRLKKVFSKEYPVWKYIVFSLVGILLASLLITICYYIYSNWDAVVNGILNIFNYPETKKTPHLNLKGYIIVDQGGKSLGDVILAILGVLIAVFAYRASANAADSAKNSVQSSLIALEEFRPKILIGDINNEFFFLKNGGDFDAYDIRIFLKTVDTIGSESSGFYEYTKNEFTLLGSSQKSEKIEINTERYYTTCLVIYKNASTDRVYLYGTNIYSNKPHPVGYDHNGFTSPLSKENYFHLIKDLSIKSQVLLNLNDKDIYNSFLERIIDM